MALISLSGIDCSGKTTLADKLAARLGAEVLTFPDRGTFVGQALDEYLRCARDLHPALAEALFFANRCEHRAKLASSAQAGSAHKTSHVIAVRYKVDALAYATLHGVELAWLRDLYAALPEPDFAVFLSCDPAVADARLQRRSTRERYERDEMKLCAAALALETIWRDESLFFGVERIRLNIDPTDANALDGAVDVAAQFIASRTDLATRHERMSP